MSLPTKLILDKFEPSPSVLTAGHAVVRASRSRHVDRAMRRRCPGRPGLRHRDAVDQFTITEQPTDSTGGPRSRLAGAIPGEQEQVSPRDVPCWKSGENVRRSHRLPAVSVPVTSIAEQPRKGAVPSERAPAKVDVAALSSQPCVSLLTRSAHTCVCSS